MYLNKLPLRLFTAIITKVKLIQMTFKKLTNERIINK